MLAQNLNYAHYPIDEMADPKVRPEWSEVVTFFFRASEYVR